MSFGDASRGFSEWSLGDEEAQPFFQQAVELGVTRLVPLVAFRSEVKLGDMTKRTEDRKSVV